MAFLLYRAGKWAAHISKHRYRKSCASTPLESLFYWLSSALKNVENGFVCVKLCAVLVGTQQLASVYVERLACAGFARVRELQGGLQRH